MPQVIGLSDALYEVDRFKESIIDDVNSAIDTLENIDFEVNTEEDAQYIESEVKNAIDTLKGALQTLED